MGFIKAFAGAIGGTFADQWKDFIVPRSDVPATAAVLELKEEEQITEEVQTQKEAKIS